jgi:hypothetical protein
VREAPAVVTLHVLRPSGWIIHAERPELAWIVWRVLESWRASLPELREAAPGDLTEWHRADVSARPPGTCPPPPASL